MQDRYARYRGFELAITHLPKCKIEVIATRTAYPAAAFYCNSMAEARKEIDRYWKECKNAKDQLAQGK